MLLNQSTNISITVHIFIFSFCLQDCNKLYLAFPCISALNYSHQSVSLRTPVSFTDIPSEQSLRHPDAPSFPFCLCADLAEAERSSRGSTAWTHCERRPTKAAQGVHPKIQNKTEIFMTKKNKKKNREKRCALHFQGTTKESRWLEGTASYFSLFNRITLLRIQSDLSDFSLLSRERKEF